MFLEKLCIAKTNGDVNNLEVLEKVREVKFKQGLNIITDDGNNTGNTVGKSTFLYLIDLCFGAKDIEKVYKNKYNQSNDNTIRDFIYDNKLVVILNIKDHKIIRPLYTKNTIILDDNMLTLQDFYEKMSKIIFNNNANKPTFRALINKFIRLEDFQIRNMLEFNHTSMSSNNKQLIRRFLFNYPDMNTLDKISEIKDSLKKYKDNNKAFSYFERNEIEQEIGVLKQQISELEQKKDEIRKVNNIDKDIFDNTNIISKYRLMKNELINKNYLINGVKSNIDTLSGKTRDININALKSLYDETVEFFSSTNISKTFEDLVSFHNKGIQQELKYMEEYLSELIYEKQQIEQELSDLNNKFVNQKLLDNLDEIISSLSILNIELGKKEKELEQLNNYEKTISQYNQELSKYQTNKDCDAVFNKNLEKFNIIFADFYKKMFKKNPSVLYIDDAGQLQINTDREKNGSGEDIGEVVAFDLAYLKFIQELNLSFPLFQIQDQLEMTDIEAKNTAFNKILPDIHCQYIIATLYSSTDKSFDNDIVLRLSQKDKLFKV